MPTLHLYGIDHRRVPADMREVLTLNAAEVRNVLPELLRSDDPGTGRGSVTEAMLLSTCNRTEIYLAVEGEPSSRLLSPLWNLRPEAATLKDERSRYHLCERAAAAHLFAVASSLRSQVAGDTRIARQVAEAAQLAREAGTMGALLETLTAASLRATKRVRRETGLMAGQSGTGPAVWQGIRRLTPGDGGERRPIRVLLLGTGRVAEEVATHLACFEPCMLGRTVSRRRVELAGVWARDHRKAARFAKPFGILALSDAQALRALEHVDAVVGACRGRVSILDEATVVEFLARRRDPLVVVDLGVPGNLDPKVAGRDGLLSVSLNDLHGEVSERSRHRQSALDAAQTILAEEVERFERRMAQWPLRPFRAEVYATMGEVLSRWRTEQPDAVRQLRVALHRMLDEAFSSVLPCHSDAIRGNQSSPEPACR